MTRYASSDGLMSSSDSEAVALWETIGARMQDEQASWTNTLRAMGVKLAHPDDGWVRRDAAQPSLGLSWYPQFNDRPEVGDLIALGSPHNHHPWKYRLVRVTRIDYGGPWIPSTDYYYEDTGIVLPPPPEPIGSSWRRLLKRVSR